MAVQIWLERNTSDKVRLPVNPPDVTIGHSFGWEVVSLATMQEYIVGGGKKLDEIVLSSFFPKHFNPGLSDFKKIPDPKAIVKKITKWGKDRSVIKLVITGDIEYVAPMVIMNFTPSIKGGDPEDIHFSLSLKEHYAPVMKKTKIKTSVKNVPKPVVKPPTPNKPKAKAEWIYVIKSGDNLWNICKKYYNAPTRCYDLAKKNGIKNANLIYPKQKLKMWAR